MIDLKTVTKNDQSLFWIFASFSQRMFLFQTIPSNDFVILSLVIFGNKCLFFECFVSLGVQMGSKATKKKIFTFGDLHFKPMKEKKENSFTQVWFIVCANYRWDVGCDFSASVIVKNFEFVKINFLKKITVGVFENSNGKFMGLILVASQLLFA